MLVYKSVLKVVNDISIGWDQVKQERTIGISGISQAYANCCEEQTRSTLHSHIFILIETFNDTHDLLYHEDSMIRQEA